jgi:hypothetical protein
MMPFESIVGVSVGFAVAQPARHEVHKVPVRVQYSAVASTETRLPEGVQPASLLANRTGSLLVGDLVFGHRSDVERTAEGALQYIQHIAAALPVDPEDERIVDALVAKRTASLGTRPLRRREGEPR